MKEWKEYKIGDLCSKVASGGTPLTSKKEYYEGGTIPWLKTTEVHKEIIRETDTFITEEGLKNSSAKLIPANSIIVAMYGDGGTAGKAAITKIPLTTNQACCNLTIDDKKADYGFVFYYLKINYDNIVNLKTGGSQQNLNALVIKNFPIFLPPILIQKQISSILSAYDDLIETNTQRIKLLEETAQQLYKEWFVRMRFPDYKKAKFVKGVPEGWEVIRIDSLYKTSSGATPSREKKEYYENGIYEWIKTGELNDSFVTETKEKISELGLKNSSAKLFPPYTVMFAMYGNTIGQLGISTTNAATNQACCALLPLTKAFDYEFIFLALLHNRGEIISFGMGAAQQNVSQDEIKKYKILKPTDDLGIKFKTIVSPMFQQIETLQSQNTHLRHLRDRLLPRLVSGKLAVKDV